MVQNVTSKSACGTNGCYWVILIALTCCQTSDIADLHALANHVCAWCP